MVSTMPAMPGMVIVGTLHIQGRYDPTLLLTDAQESFIPLTEAGVVRARGMRLLSPKLTLRMTAAFTDGIRWADIPAVRSVDDIPALLRADALAPVAGIFVDLGRTHDVLGTSQTLHLLPLIDDAADARSLARLSEALGPRTVSHVEVLGKSRLFRATVRLSDTALELTVSLLGVMASIGAAATHMIQSVIFRRLGRFARRR